MLSYIILLCLALGINAAPANPDKHAHQAIHLKRMDRHRHHAHARVASAQEGDFKTVYGKRDNVAPKVVYATSVHTQSESRPEWVRKRF